MDTVLAKGPKPVPVRGPLIPNIFLYAPDIWLPYPRCAVPHATVRLFPSISLFPIFSSSRGILGTVSDCIQRKYGGNEEAGSLKLLEPFRYLCKPMARCRMWRDTTSSHAGGTSSLDKKRYLH